MSVTTPAPLSLEAWSVRVVGSAVLVVVVEEEELVLPPGDLEDARSVPGFPVLPGMSPLEPLPKRYRLVEYS